METGVVAGLLKGAQRSVVRTAMGDAQVPSSALLLRRRFPTLQSLRVEPLDPSNASGLGLKRCTMQVPRTARREAEPSLRESAGSTPVEAVAISQAALHHACTRVPEGDGGLTARLDEMLVAERTVVRLALQRTSLATLTRFLWLRCQMAERVSEVDDAASFAMAVRRAVATAPFLNVAMCPSLVIDPTPQGNPNLRLATVQGPRFDLASVLVDDETWKKADDARSFAKTFPRIHEQISAPVMCSEDALGAFPHIVGRDVRWGVDDAIVAFIGMPQHLAVCGAELQSVHTVMGTLLRAVVAAPDGRARLHAEALALSPLVQSLSYLQHPDLWKAYSGQVTDTVDCTRRSNFEYLAMHSLAAVARKFPAAPVTAAVLARSTWMWSERGPPCSAGWVLVTLLRAGSTVVCAAPAVAADVGLRAPVPFSFHNGGLLVLMLTREDWLTTDCASCGAGTVVISRSYTTYRRLLQVARRLRNLSTLAAASKPLPFPRHSRHLFTKWTTDDSGSPGSAAAISVDSRLPLGRLDDLTSPSIATLMRSICIGRPAAVPHTTLADALGWSHEYGHDAASQLLHRYLATLVSVPAGAGDAPAVRFVRTLRVGAVFGDAVAVAGPGGDGYYVLSDPRATVH